MTTEQELWACALPMLERYGDQAPRAIAERIGALSLEGDHAGIATWQGIASRVDQLIRNEEKVQ